MGKRKASALPKYFAAAAVALAAAAAATTYTKQRSSNAMVLSPAISRVAPPQQQQQQQQAQAQAQAAFPVVLPPSVSAAEVPHLQRTFLAQCEEAAQLGLPSAEEVRCYGGYLSSLNYERRVPNWVLEVIHYDRLRAGKAADDSGSDSDGGAAAAVTRKNSSFYEDRTVPAAFRVKTTSYPTEDGLSRGHLAAAQFHKGSQGEMDATFNMNANMVPQDMTVNAVDWARVEGLTRKLSKEVAAHGGRLFVATGPAFVPRRLAVSRGRDGVRRQTPVAQGGRLFVQYELTEKDQQHVAVPTHLFKLLVAETKGRGGASRYEAAAFLVPNEAIPEELPLARYQVPVERLEEITGLQFFPGLRAATLSDLCRSHKCEAKSPALFQRFRQVAQLRAADSVPELRQVRERLAATGPLDAAVEKEFVRKTAELVAEAMRSADDV